MKGAIFLVAGASASLLHDITGRQLKIKEITCNNVKISCESGMDCSAKCSDIPESFKVTCSEEYSCTEDCFPGDAVVQLESGETITMDKLKVNDKVLTSNGYAPVYMFTHVEKATKVEYHKIETASGKTLRVSGGHLVHLNGSERPVSARLAAVGHTVTLADGTQDEVVSITKEVKEGLYAPQTLTNDIVVDGVLASTFTDVASTEMQAMFLSPMQMLYRMGGASWMGRSEDSAIPQWLRNVALALKK